MAFVPLKCPNCLRISAISPDRDNAFCQNCGAKINVKVEIEKQRSSTYTAQELADFSEATKIYSSNKPPICNSTPAYANNTSNESPLDSSSFVLSLLIIMIVTFLLGIIIGGAIYLVLTICIIVSNIDKGKASAVGGCIGLIVGALLAVAFGSLF